MYTAEKADTVVSRLLSMGPFVFVGLISYSFYLWHWPIFVFARYAQNSELTQIQGLALAALAMLMAYLSWRFVEPVRNLAPGKRGPAFVVGILCILVASGFGLAGRIGKGLPGRLPAEVARIGMVGLDINPNRKLCDGRSPERIDADDVCRVGMKGGAITFVVLGDSFGDAFAPGIDTVANEHGRTGYAITKGGCVPMFGTSQDSGSCKAFLQAALRLIKRHPEIKTVILVGRWTTVSEGTRFGANNLTDMFVSDEKTTKMGYDENRRVLERGLKRTLDALSGRQVYITAFIPEQRSNVPRTMALNRYFGISADVSVDRASFDRRQQFIRDLLAKLGVQYRFGVIDVGAALCSASKCIASEHGLPIYVDDNHLSRQEAINLRGLFVPAFR